ncbi:hypothetical protein Pcinc_011105 [Petrolisthes cinctipes]|uniref:RING-type domain-containing protein n=1 Tax=Petrolisthes cinctipes TaxID=88211 RepID=A0AAE1G1I2_PETCI|nr:hypothetical protein Pcinc_011105 [Petrolisthes cinctipes]
MASEEEDEGLKCGQCLLRYGKGERCPRSLFCGHTFCTSCLDQAIGAGNRRCPSCNRSFFSQKATQLPTDFALLRRATADSLTPSSSVSSTSLVSMRSAGIYTSQLKPLSSSSEPPGAETRVVGSASGGRPLLLPLIGQSSPSLSKMEARLSPTLPSPKTPLYGGMLFKSRLSTIEDEAPSDSPTYKSQRKYSIASDRSSSPYISPTRRFPHLRSSLSTSTQEEKIQEKIYTDKEEEKRMSASSHPTLKQTSPSQLTASVPELTTLNVNESADKVKRHTPSSMSRTSSESALLNNSPTSYHSIGGDITPHISHSFSDLSLNNGMSKHEHYNSVDSSSEEIRNNNDFESSRSLPNSIMSSGSLPSLHKMETKLPSYISGAKKESKLSEDKMSTSSKKEKKPSQDEVDRGILNWKIDSGLSLSGTTKLRDKTSIERTSSTPSHVLKMCRSITSKARPESTEASNLPSDTNDKTEAERTNPQHEPMMESERYDKHQGQQRQDFGIMPQEQKGDDIQTKTNKVNDSDKLSHSSSLSDRLAARGYRFTTKLDEKDTELDITNVKKTNNHQDNQDKVDGGSRTAKSTQSTSLASRNSRLSRISQDESSGASSYREGSYIGASERYNMTKLEKSNVLTPRFSNWQMKKKPEQSTSTQVQETTREGVVKKEEVMEHGKDMVNKQEEVMERNDERRGEMKGSDDSSLEDKTRGRWYTSLRNSDFMQGKSYDTIQTQSKLRSVYDERNSGPMIRKEENIYDKSNTDATHTPSQAKINTPDNPLGASSSPVTSRVSRERSRFPPQSPSDNTINTTTTRSVSENVQKLTKEESLRGYHSINSNTKEIQSSSSNATKTTLTDTSLPMIKNRNSIDMIKSLRLSPSRSSRSTFSLTDYHSMLLGKPPRQIEESDSETEELYGRSSSRSTESEKKQVSQYNDMQTKDDKHSLQDKAYQYRSGSSEECTDDVSKGATQHTTQWDQTDHLNSGGISGSPSVTPGNDNRSQQSESTTHVTKSSKESRHSKDQSHQTQETSTSAITTTNTTWKKYESSGRRKVPYTELLGEVHIGSVPSIQADDETSSLTEENEKKSVALQNSHKEKLHYTRPSERRATAAKTTTLNQRESAEIKDSAAVEIDVSDGKNNNKQDKVHSRYEKDQDIVTRVKLKLAKRRDRDSPLPFPNETDVNTDNSAAVNGGTTERELHKSGDTQEKRNHHRLRKESHISSRQRWARHRNTNEGLKEKKEKEAKEKEKEEEEKEKEKKEEDKKEKMKEEEKIEEDKKKEEDKGKEKKEEQKEKDPGSELRRVRNRLRNTLDTSPPSPSPNARSNLGIPPPPPQTKSRDSPKTPVLQPHAKASSHKLSFDRFRLKDKVEDEKSRYNSTDEQKDNLFEDEVSQTASFDGREEGMVSASASAIPDQKSSSHQTESNVFLKDNMADEEDAMRMNDYEVQFTTESTHRPNELFNTSSEMYNDYNETWEGETSAGSVETTITSHKQMAELPQASTVVSEDNVDSTDMHIGLSDHQTRKINFSDTNSLPDTVHYLEPLLGVGVCGTHRLLLHQYCTHCQEWVCQGCVKENHSPQNGCHVISGADAVSHMKLTHSAFLNAKVNTLESFREQLRHIMTKCDKSLREHQCNIDQLKLKLRDEETLLQGIHAMKNLALQKWQQVDYWEELLGENAERIAQSTSSEEVMTAVQAATSTILARVMDGSTPHHPPAPSFNPPPTYLVPTQHFYSSYAHL